MPFAVNTNVTAVDQIDMNRSEASIVVSVRLDKAKGLPELDPKQSLSIAPKYPNYSPS